jgi:hypothetical protein
VVLPRVFHCGSLRLHLLGSSDYFLNPTHRLAAMGIRGVVVLAPLPFFIWGAREMFRSFKNAGRHL